MIARLLTISGFFETPTCRLTVLHFTLCIKKFIKIYAKKFSEINTFLVKKH